MFSSQIEHFASSKHPQSALVANSKNRGKRGFCILKTVRISQPSMRTFFKPILKTSSLGLRMKNPRKPGFFGILKTSPKRPHSNLASHPHRPHHPYRKGWEAMEPRFCGLENQVWTKGVKPPAHEIRGLTYSTFPSDCEGERMLFLRCSLASIIEHLKCDHVLALGNTEEYPGHRAQIPRRRYSQVTARHWLGRKRALEARTNRQAAHQFNRTWRIALRSIEDATAEFSRLGYISGCASSVRRQKPCLAADCRRETHSFDRPLPGECGPQIGLGSIQWDRAQAATRTLQRKTGGRPVGAGGGFPARKNGAGTYGRPLSEKTRIPKFFLKPRRRILATAA